MTVPVPVAVTATVRSLYAPVLAGAAVLSVAGSLARVPAAWSMAGLAVLLPLLALVARWSPVRSGSPAAALGIVAVALWPAPLVRDQGASWLEAFGAAAFWAVPGLGAAAVGAHLRRQASQTRQAVRDARRHQQLELARDPHDFVAHDVSAILVQAQAARFVADSDPRQAVRALERIEAAGLSALASLDRTVHALREAGGGPAAPTPGLAELDALVGRFEGGVLEAEEEALASLALAREADTAAYRVAVEALTNVRRHAPGARTVRVTVRRRPDGIELAVTNTAPPRTPRPLRKPLARRRPAGGGTGIAGLRERVAAAGGTLAAGPAGAGGWRVSAVFPAPAGPHG
ncbi:sensor histidine kinase [Streptomyces sp. NPDC059851]|uniref:sensor histidine kinase n=1 Tax=Streptomyces sp. NPDC059851 TaxID=3346971 RepID=UPI003666A139